MVRPAIDLAAYITQNAPRDSPLFPIELRPLCCRAGTEFLEVPRRQAVVRTDSGKVIGVIAASSKLVAHQAVLIACDGAAKRLDVGPVPRATYLDRGGARMQELLTFPGLSEPVRGTDRVCPAIVVQNTYGRSERILIHLGTFRFACGNLAIGGGGVFPQGYMRVTTSEFPIDQLVQQLEWCLSVFCRIVRTYRIWAERPLDRQGMDFVLEGLPAAITTRIWSRVNTDQAATVYAAYQAALHVATHEMPSFHRAFHLLEHINAGFQRVFRSR